MKLDFSRFLPVVVSIVAVCTVAGTMPNDPAVATKRFPSIDEARERARLLHETIHGSLQVMHRDFFDDEESRSIPSRSLEDVFSELESRHKVSVRWLVVNAQAMNVDNRAKDDFERSAVKVLSDGTTEFESVENDVYRYAGSIVLASQCLKCHAPMRTSTKDQYAGLSIAIPLKARSR